MKVRNSTLGSINDNGEGRLQCRIVFANGHCYLLSPRSSAHCTCTGSTPQAQAARNCHAKEGGVGVSRHWGVEAAVCVVVAAHASADVWDATPELRAGVPRVRKDEDEPLDRALLGGSEAGGVPTAARLPPGAGASWVTGSPNCVSARPQPRQSQVGDAGARAEAAPGSEPGGLGCSASSTSKPSPCAAAQGGVAAAPSSPVAL